MGCEPPNGTAARPAPSSAEPSPAGAAGASAKSPAQTPPPDPQALALAEREAQFPEQQDFDPAQQSGRWFDAAFGLADREHVTKAFKAADYKAPRGSLLSVVRIEPGVDQARLHYFTIGDTGFLAAPKYFVPASTVKLMASVAALWTLSKHGLDGDTRLDFKDIQGRFHGNAYKLYKDALLHSSNENYNRLIGIAGFDEVNTEYITAERGLPVMAIQSRYGAANRGKSLRGSPTITYLQDGKEGEIAARKGTWRRSDCRGNCTTLFELQDIMRRVVMHDEIPKPERFPLARVDLERIQGLLLQARDRLQPSPNRAFAEKVQVYNEVGRIPGRVLLENSYLVGETSGRRVMLALSLRFPQEHDPKPDLQVMARQALDATLDAPLAGPGLQKDAGVPLELSLRFASAQSDAAGVLWTRALSQEVDTAQAWLGNQALRPLDPIAVDGVRFFAWELPAGTGPARGAVPAPESPSDPSQAPAAPEASPALPFIVVAKREGHEVAYISRWRSSAHAVPQAP